MREKIKQGRRWVIKVGSSLVTNNGLGLDTNAIEDWAGQLVAMQKTGIQLVLVSSGAVAEGVARLGLKTRPKQVHLQQAAAAVGQIALARAWAEALDAEGITTGQVLVTIDDTEARRRYLNARATIGALLRMGAVPVINENDTVATSEIRYGDNDRLAARVATMMNADLLIILSDVDGLYTASPAIDPDAKHLAEVAAITPEIEAMAGGAASELSRGGMRTKIEAGKIATHAGTAMIITLGGVDHPLKALDSGDRCTLFQPQSAPVSAWKSWIAGQLEPQGRVVVDEGAARALRSGKSLLAAGVRTVQGTFQRGDTLAIVMEGTGAEIGRGLAGYDSGEAIRIAGRKTSEIEAILGYAPRAAMIHRDDMVVKP